MRNGSGLKGAAAISESGYGGEGVATPAVAERVSPVVAAAKEPTFPVAERFTSINGEGRDAGRLATFVRFTGCNLRCSYCDTMWANEPGCPAECMTLSEIVAFVRAEGTGRVTLTGGEPLLQPGVDALIGALVDDGNAVEIETNGAVDLGSFVGLRKRDAADPAACPELCGSDSVSAQSSIPRLSFTMDWKLPSSGMGSHMLASNLALLGLRDTVKFVAGSDADLEEALRIMQAHDLCARTNVYLSPVFGQIEPARIVEFMQRNRLTQATVQLQLHKIIWPNVEKGV